MENTQDALAELRIGQRGTLVVGVHPSDLDYHITKQLIDFHADFPKVKLQLVTSINEGSYSG
ncbi:hypothetical protein [Bacillus sp. FJAT-26390]|uniref:hypothetical protein n=1 Tax=Bacillus sp. FJAT-26390 TaxID=1743142 RepID=UPI00080830B3|nr:hypothetical protein [Bacillus sp. FJAT-26390]